MSGYIVGPTLMPGERPWPDQWETSETVAACPHDTWESVLLRPRYLRVEEVVRCAACHAPRCGHTGDPDPCLLVRRHRAHHVKLSGALLPIGGYKCANGVDCGCGPRYAS